MKYTLCLLIVILAHSRMQGMVETKELKARAQVEVENKISAQKKQNFVTTIKLLKKLLPPLQAYINSFDKKITQLMELSCDGLSYIQNAIPFKDTDGWKIVTHSWANNLHVFSLKDRKLVHMLQGHTGRISEMVPYQDDTQWQAISWSEDGTFRIWDLTTGKQLHEITDILRMEPTIHIFNDGKSMKALAVPQAGNVHDACILDLAKGRICSVIQDFADKKASTILYRDGAAPYALTLSLDGTVRIWDLTTGSFVKAFSTHDLSAKILLYQDAKGWKAVLSTENTMLSVWDLTENICIKKLKPDAEWSALEAVYQDATGWKALYSSHGKPLQIWDITTGEVSALVDGSNHAPSFQAIYHDAFGLKLIYNTGATVRIVDLATKKQILTFEAVEMPTIRMLYHDAEGIKIITTSYTTDHLHRECGSIQIWGYTQGDKAAIIRNALSPEQMSVTQLLRKLATEPDDKTSEKVKEIIYDYAVKEAS